MEFMMKLCGLDLYLSDRPSTCPNFFMWGNWEFSHKTDQTMYSSIYTVPIYTITVFILVKINICL